MEDVLAHLRPKDIRRKWYLPLWVLKVCKEGIGLIGMHTLKSLLCVKFGKDSDTIELVGDFTGDRGFVVFI